MLIKCSASKLFLYADRQRKGHHRAVSRIGKVVMGSHYLGFRIQLSIIQIVIVLFYNYSLTTGLNL